MSATWLKAASSAGSHTRWKRALLLRDTTHGPAAQQLHQHEGADVWRFLTTGKLPTWQQQPQSAQPQPASQPQQVTNNFHVTMNASGVADQSTFDHLLTKLTDAIKAALTHASGTGVGSDMSMFTVGGPN